MTVPSPGGGAAPPTSMIAQQVAMVARQAAQIETSAKSFSASAGTGFHIDPQAAATLINACRDGLTELQQLREYLDTIAQHPQLGQTPGAKVVAPFTQSAATDSEGMKPTIDKLQQTLLDMIQAYQKASTNYSETEALVTQAMKQHQTLLSPAAAPMLKG
jgi:hypothetical protein